MNGARRPQSLFALWSVQSQTGEGTIAHLPQEVPPADESSTANLLGLRTSRSELAAWLLIGAGVLLVLARDLVPALVAGLLFFLLLERTSLTIGGLISGRALKPLALLIGTVVGGAAVTGAIALLVMIVRVQLRNIPALMTRMAEILESTRMWLLRIGGYQLFPDAVRDAEDLKQLAVTWLKENAGILGIAGETFSRAVLHIIMGLLLGMMVFLRHQRRADDRPHGNLAQHLIEKVNRFTDAFRQVVAAQVTISAINTALTAIYLLIALPLSGKPLPFSKTIIFITFVCGLIPVLGNLISNTVIVIVSLGLGLGTALASLVFLVTIHKLEYVVNSRIIGSRTGSDIWEILLAIIVGEAIFGVQGVIMAPVIYTFIKRELLAKRLV